LNQLPEKLTPLSLVGCLLGLTSSSILFDRLEEDMVGHCGWLLPFEWLPNHGLWSFFVEVAKTENFGGWVKFLVMRFSFSTNSIISSLGDPGKSSVGKVCWVTPHLLQIRSDRSNWLWYCMTSMHPRHQVWPHTWLRMGSEASPGVVE
jgi:hypothetical protein